MNLVVHRVEAKLVSVMDEQAAGLVLGNWSKRVAGIFFPVSQIVRNGNPVGPEF